MAVPLNAYAYDNAVHLLDQAHRTLRRGGNVQKAQSLTETINQSVRNLNAWNSQITSRSPLEVKKAYFAARNVIESWNRHVESHSQLGSFKIRYKGVLETNSTVFTADRFACTYETAEGTPLVVTPKEESGLTSLTDFQDWARAHQGEIACEIQTHGAVVFRQSTPLSNQDIAETFTAVTGMATFSYAGSDGPRDLLDETHHVYGPLKRQPNFHIRPHQLRSHEPLQRRPDILGFYCAEASREGTGETTFADPRVVTRQLKRERIWDTVYAGKYFDYWSSHPGDGCLGRVIRGMNRSHKTVRECFGTTDPDQIRAFCERENLEVERGGWPWNRDWVTVWRRNIPATMMWDGEEVICSQPYFSRFTPELCGLGNYIGASLLYSIPGANYSGVNYSNGGGQVSFRAMGQTLRVLDRCEIPYSWKAHDLLFKDNRWMHGHRPYNPQEGRRDIRMVLGKQTQPPS